MLEQVRKKEELPPAVIMACGAAAAIAATAATFPLEVIRRRLMANSLQARPISFLLDYLPFPSQLCGV